MVLRHGSERSAVLVMEAQVLCAGVVDCVKEKVHELTVLRGGWFRQENTKDCHQTQLFIHRFPSWDTLYSIDCLALPELNTI